MLGGGGGVLTVITKDFLHFILSYYLTEILSPFTCILFFLVLPTLIWGTVFPPKRPLSQKNQFENARLVLLLQILENPEGSQPTGTLAPTLPSLLSHLCGAHACG